MTEKEDKDLVLDGLIEAYLILESEIIKDYKKVDENVHKLRKYDIKLDFLNERVEIEKIITNGGVQERLS